MASSLGTLTLLVECDWLASLGTVPPFQRIAEGHTQQADGDSSVDSDEVSAAAGGCVLLLMEKRSGTTSSGSGIFFDNYLVVPARQSRIGITDNTNNNSSSNNSDSYTQPLRVYIHLLSGAAVAAGITEKYELLFHDSHLIDLIIADNTNTNDNNNNNNKEVSISEWYVRIALPIPPDCRMDSFFLQRAPLLASSTNTSVSLNEWHKHVVMCLYNGSCTDPALEPLSTLPDSDIVKVTECVFRKLYSFCCDLGGDNNSEDIIPVWTGDVERALLHVLFGMCYNAENECRTVNNNNNENDKNTCSKSVTGAEEAMKRLSSWADFLSTRIHNPLLQRSEPAPSGTTTVQKKGAGTSRSATPLQSGIVTSLPAPRCPMPRVRSVSEVATTAPQHRTSVIGIPSFTPTQQSPEKRKGSGLQRSGASLPTPTAPSCITTSVLGQSSSPSSSLLSVCAPARVHQRYQPVITDGFQLTESWKPSAAVRSGSAADFLAELHDMACQYEAAGDDYDDTASMHSFINRSDDSRDSNPAYAFDTLARRHLQLQLHHIRQNHLLPSLRLLDELNTLPYYLHVWYYSYDPLHDTRKHRSFMESYVSSSNLMSKVISFFSTMVSSSSSSGPGAAFGATGGGGSHSAVASGSTSGSPPDPSLYLSVCALYVTTDDIILRTIPSEQKQQQRHGRQGKRASAAEGAPTQRQKDLKMDRVQSAPLLDRRDPARKGVHFTSMHDNDKKAKRNIGADSFNPDEGEEYDDDEQQQPTDAEVLVLPRVAITAVTRFTVNRAADGVFSEKCAHKIFVADESERHSNSKNGGGVRATTHATLKPYLATRRSKEPKQQAATVSPTKVVRAGDRPQHQLPPPASSLSNWWRFTAPAPRGPAEGSAQADYSKPQKSTSNYAPSSSSNNADRSICSVVLKIEMKTLQTLWLEFADEESLDYVYDLLQRPLPFRETLCETFASSNSGASPEASEATCSPSQSPAPPSSSTPEKANNTTNTPSGKDVSSSKASVKGVASAVSHQQRQLLHSIAASPVKWLACTSFLYTPLTGNRFITSARRPWCVANLALTAGGILPPESCQSPYFAQLLRNVSVAWAISTMHPRGSGGDAAGITGRDSPEGTNTPLLTSGAKRAATDTRTSLSPDTALSHSQRSALSRTWWLYDPDREYGRQSLTPQSWKLTRANHDYALCPSYPAAFVVPSRMEADLESGVIDSQHRTKRRMEAVTYFYAPTGGTLVRSAQPAVARHCWVAVARAATASNATTDNSKDAGKGSAEAADNHEQQQGNHSASVLSRALEALTKSADVPRDRLLVLDLRPKHAALGNTMMGGGSMMFLEGIPVNFARLGNIHVVRDAWRMMRAALYDGPMILLGQSDPRTLWESGEPPYTAVVTAAETTSSSGAGKEAAAGRVILYNRSTASSAGTAAAAEASAEPLDEEVQAKDAACDDRQKQQQPWLRSLHALINTAATAARQVCGLPVDPLYSPAIAHNGADPNCFSHIVGHDFVQVSLAPPSTAAWHPQSSRHRPVADSTAPYGQSMPSYMTEVHTALAHVVLLNCTDGWDRTSQVAALTQMMLDPYFRTVEGFCILLEKDFVGFGHPARRRATAIDGNRRRSQQDGGGGGQPLRGDSDANARPMRRTAAAASDELGGKASRGEDWEVLWLTEREDSPLPQPSFISAEQQQQQQSGGLTLYDAEEETKHQYAPILFQFFDCVRQLVRLYPNSFEFTESFVLLIVDLMHAGLVSTFAVNCEAEVATEHATDSCLSISQWCALLLATTPAATPSHAHSRSQNHTEAASRKPNEQQPKPPCSNNMIDGSSTQQQGMGSSVESFLRIDPAAPPPYANDSFMCSGSGLGKSRRASPAPAADGSGQSCDTAAQADEGSLAHFDWTAQLPPRSASGGVVFPARWLPSTATKSASNNGYSLAAATAAAVGASSTSDSLSPQAAGKRRKEAPLFASSASASPHAHGSSSSCSISPSAADFTQRLLPVSADAMHHSGYLNPKFSLRVCATVSGPLVDYVPYARLSVWEDFFLRHNFWEERRVRLRSVTAQHIRADATTVYAPVPSSSPLTVVSSHHSPYSNINNSSNDLGRSYAPHNNARRGNNRTELYNFHLASSNDDDDDGTTEDDDDTFGAEEIVY